MGSKHVDNQQDKRATFVSSVRNFARLLGPCATHCDDVVEIRTDCDGANVIVNRVLRPSTGPLGPFTLCVMRIDFNDTVTRLHKEYELVKEHIDGLLTRTGAGDLQALPLAA